MSELVLGGEGVRRCVSSTGRDRVHFCAFNSALIAWKCAYTERISFHTEEVVKHPAVAQAVLAHVSVFACAHCVVHLAGEAWPGVSAAQLQDFHSCAGALAVADYDQARNGWEWYAASHNTALLLL